MKAVSVLLGLGICLISCGIDSVATLPAPSVNYNSQTVFQSMTLTHSASRYSGTVFQGYQVYYRIYPESSSSVGSLRLATDISTLGSGPLSTLIAMGYQPLTRSASNDVQYTNEPLLITGLSDGDVVVLDFSTFLGSTDVTVQPVLRINSAVHDQIYRAAAIVSGNAAGQQKFSTLRTATTLSSDTSALATEFPLTYEVEFFLVAYGMTPTIETIFSTPMGWGTVQYIHP